MQTIENVAQRSVEYGNSEAAEMKKRLTAFKDRAGDFVQENPGLSVMGAFAVGFVLAKVARYA